MGYFKERWQSAMKRGYTPPANSYVCPACVSDGHLAPTLARRCVDEACSYCGRKGAADISALLDEIGDALLAEYQDPAEQLPYESREGGYQGVVYDGAELVHALDPWTANEELLEDVASAFAGSIWCERDYFSLDEFQSLSYGWRDFSRQVKHRTRFLFLQELGEEEPNEPNHDQIPPGRMLDSLAQLFEQFDLFCTLATDTTLIRARVVDPGERPSEAASLGTAPLAQAIYPNRMSPAGIPMFYAAYDERTAVLETYEPCEEKKDIALGRWKISRPLTLLDLTDLPGMPSIFDRENRRERRPIHFLRAFERDFTTPVPRGRRAVVKYVPTQVVTEYVRHRLCSPDGGSIDGIQYRSSRTMASTAVVIFAEHEQCGPRIDRERWDPEPFLHLEDVRYVDADEFLSAA